MTLANKFTTSRLIMAPVFFVIYLLPRFLPSNFAFMPADGGNIPIGVLCSITILWLIFFLSWISDLLDGHIARKRGEVSDFGKVFDPFADTLAQITFFFCFVLDGILSPLFFLAVLYREFSILFVRNLMLKKGIAMGARMGGKIKTVAYISAVGLALLASSLLRLGFGGEIYRWSVIAAQVVFIISVIIAVVSFFDYLSVYKKTPENKY
ncbi:MAG: CDP-diacylglycerol--glycerol-3-phosphate 3-phosphatidyltransferase [Treponema sp.]|nr:CDP-diacylglycerol--glycerol-3-phosphate 3-phosphatidyltransferase [Treponema sp.]